MLTTQWGVALDREHPLPEYPRPQYARDSYLNLNGLWDYAIWPSQSGFAGWQGQIVVPFSPEAALSGVSRTLRPDETLFYRTTFEATADFLKDVTLLHFGAVDSSCVTQVNGEVVGGHQGGYTPFQIDISRAVRPGENELIVEVTDPTDTSWVSRGKQSSRPGGIWYTAQSGIWQTVWLESLPADYLESVQMVSDIDRQLLQVTPSRNCRAIVFGSEFDLIGEQVNDIPVPNAAEWTPETPHLYDIDFSRGDDTVHSYFGMRKYSIGRDDAGHARLLLNNRPFFQHGLLDQGYWPDGLLTPPSDEAMLGDIQQAKRLGFNMLRKHIKIEPARWYHHCDREGMLVWQDMVNGGSRHNPLVTMGLPFLGLHLADAPSTRFGRANQEGRNAYHRELDEMLHALRNCVCVATWVPFNEGWGQFDANQTADHVKQRDPSRIVDHASGWHDQGGGDIQSLHVYFRKVSLPAPDDRVLALTEFGGYSRAIENHVWRPGKVFGYKVFKTNESWVAGFEMLYREQVLPLVSQGLSATVYTQLTDVEDEVNGLITYDREVCKLPEEVGLAIADKLQRSIA